MSVWPPTHKACATLPPQTYMCEVGRQHKTHMHSLTRAQTHTEITTIKVLLVLMFSDLFSISVLLNKYY